MRALLLTALVSTACSSAPPLPAPLADTSGLLNVGFVVVDGVYNTELTAPLDVFHHTVFHTSPGMRVFTVAPSLEFITTFEGLRLMPDYSFASAPPVDVLVVPSAEHSMDTDLENEAMIGYVRRAGEAASYVVSLCDGAFVLAEAGLLDGHSATTFPADVEALRERFPAVDVIDLPITVHDRKAITSPGGFLSHIPALYLCDVLFGPEVADGVARGMAMTWDRADSRAATLIIEH